MKQDLTRRNFLASAGTATMAVAATTGVAAESASAGNRLKILSIACSPRKGMTTAKAVQAALDAAKSVDSRIEVELIDLGGLNIAGPHNLGNTWVKPLPGFRGTPLKRYPG